MNSLLIMISLFLSVNAYCYDLNKIYNNEAVQNLKSNLSNSEEIKLLEQGIREMVINLEKKIKNADSIVLSEVYGDQENMWNDCFYEFWKIEGVKVSRSVREFIIDTHAKKNLNLRADRVYGGRIFSTASKFSKQECLNLIK